MTDHLDPRGNAEFFNARILFCVFENQSIFLQDSTSPGGCSSQRPVMHMHESRQRQRPEQRRAARDFARIAIDWRYEGMTGDGLVSGAPSHNEKLT